MSDQQTVSPADQAEGEDLAPAIPAAVQGAWQSMIAAVPDTEGGDGYERIFAQLAGAETLDDLNSPWQSDDIARLVDLPITISTVTKSPSTYAGGLPFFLVVGATIEETGEMVTVTTGSANIVAQLVRAYSMGQLPCRAKVKIADKPTKAGYFPQRLEFLPAKRAAANGSGSAS